MGAAGRVSPMAASTIGAAAAALLLLPSGASAHGGHEAGIPSSWPVPPWPVLLLLLSALLYGIGMVRLHGRQRGGRTLLARRHGLFWSGWALVALALLSPIHRLGEALFSVHMVEHEILMIGAAPLLVAARPGAVLLWGLPGQGAGRGLARGAASGLRTLLRRLAPAWRALTEPWLGTVLHGVALWAWHLPGPFRAALRDEGLHTLQHASFFCSALLFWSGMLARGRAASGTAVFLLFATATHCGLLGALLTFSRGLWYPDDGAAAALLGLSGQEDQQLAGLVMWIPVGAVYAVAALILAWRWIDAQGWRVRHGT